MNRSSSLGTGSWYERHLKYKVHDTKFLKILCDTKHLSINSIFRLMQGRVLSTADCHSMWMTDLSIEMSDRFP